MHACFGGRGAACRWLCARGRFGCRVRVCVQCLHLTCFVSLLCWGRVSTLVLASHHLLSLVAPAVCCGGKCMYCVWKEVCWKRRLEEKA